jgi:hypothetical protein
MRWRAVGVNPRVRLSWEVRNKEQPESFGDPKKRFRVEGAVPCANCTRPKPAGLRLLHPELLDEGTPI